MPVPLDEYPIHQAALSMAHVATTDRNFYDRWYFMGHDRSGDIMFIAGMGYYPHAGVKDGFLCVRRGDRQDVVRCSDAYDSGADDRLSPAVCGLRVEVLEPLARVRFVADTDEQGVAADLTWDGSFVAVDEERHTLRQGTQTIVDTWRFAQVGTWSGEVRLGGDTVVVDPDTWVGSRDRSWGRRPIGDSDPAGRPPMPPGRRARGDGWGFWWLYVPVRFDDFAIVLILQEEGDGHRTLNHAERILPDGTIEQLGWPRITMHYQPGTRIPTAAQIELTEPDGDTSTLVVESLGYIPLHVGCGYGGDTDWLNGQWKGERWISPVSYDMTSPEVMKRVQWGVVDHVGKASLNGQTGWGLFEHGTIGAHRPSGFADLGAVAP